MVIISGGFDPVHVGHIALIREAAKYGNLHILLNSDEWLIRKKGKYFMNWQERKTILENIKGVVEVHNVDDLDGTVCKALEKLKPEYFANGGDRGPTSTPELFLCKKLGIEAIFNVGGIKKQSSSDLLNEYVEKGI